MRHGGSIIKKKLQNTKEIADEINYIEIIEYSNETDYHNIEADRLHNDLYEIDEPIENDMETEAELPEGDTLCLEDSVKTYLKEIGIFPLLSREQEVETAIWMENGDDSARELMINSNLRLVVSVAKRYVGGSNMNLLDLIQEGNLRLLKAVARYDYRKGYKFSTYAIWWIRQAITRGISDQSKTIRIPVHMKEQMNRIGRASRQFMVDKGREPTTAEIAGIMNIPLEHMEEIKKLCGDTLSLDTPVGEEEDSVLMDFVADDKSAEQFSSLDYRFLSNKINHILASSNLSGREQRIIRLRFGFVDGRTRTLEEVGKEFHLTRERIRQIEVRALRRLSIKSEIQKLKSYLD